MATQSTTARHTAIDVVDQWRHRWKGMADACMTANRLDLINRVATAIAPVVVPREDAEGWTPEQFARLMPELSEDERHKILAERCVKCGHDPSTLQNGTCYARYAHLDPAQPCGCRCIFPSAESVQSVGQQTLASHFNGHDWLTTPRELTAAIDAAIVSAEKVAIAKEREQCAAAVEDFDDWIFCTCSECKADAGSHAVKTEASLQKIVSTIRDRNF